MDEEAKIEVVRGDHGGFATVDEMKDFVIAHFERLINRGDMSAIADNVRSDYVDHDGPGGGTTSLDQSRARTAGTLKALKDLRVEIRDVVGDRDRVVVRNVWTAFDPARGKTITRRGFVLFRLRGGKLAERWATITDAEPLLSTAPEW